jgi:F5/8 type C domain-containing protein/dolichyl-phosphate-mannose-protein mannosyltransferase
MPANVDAPSSSDVLTDARTSARLSHRGIWIAVAGALLAVVFLALRYRLALTPALAETYYDEALTGLMALAILHGAPQVFYWGEPYGGAIGDAYPAALGFWLFGPSTLVLRMASAVIAVLWAWSVWFIARRAGAGPFAFLAGLLVAVPPVFLSHAQLSTHGESSALALGMVALASAAYLIDARATPARAAAWAILGLASGLSWWSSQIGAMLLLAAALVLVVARPQVFRGPGPYAALGLFLLASLPFWVWNAHHEWATFRHLATWGDPLPPWHTRFQIVGKTVLESLRDYFWDGRAVRLPSWARALSWIAVLGAYVPGLVIAGSRGAVWAQRIRRRERPWRDPLDLVAAAFWATVAAHLLTWFGTSTVLRYAMTFHGTLPVLCAVALARLAASGWTPVAGAVAAALLGFNLVTHVAFVRDAGTEPWRPVDAAIARLQALDIHSCYADGRIAQVVTFESTERVFCSDYVGFRNYAFLRAVDRVDDPSAVAIVAHRVLRRPAPDVMAQALELLGAQFKREDVGDYTIFHGFVAPGPVKPIAPAGWAARASSRNETAGLALDRRVWTRWTAPQQPGQWFEVDLGRPYPVAQVTLASAPWPSEAPAGLLVETSVDGSTWRTVASVRDVLPGLHWWKGHPRIDDSGRVIVRMEPQPTRYVRLVETRSREPGALWSIAELFLYEAATTPWEPPPAAAEAVATAERQLDHWMDDPDGPNPDRAPVTYEHRRAQVPWSAVFAGANSALALAPEWEGSHHLYGRALARAGWSDAFDADVERAATDQAWGEVVRWAEEADAVPEGLWRRGRLERWAEALDRLGRSDAAAALRRRPAPAPALLTRTRFGEALDLVGVDLPREVRPGDTVTVRYHWRLTQALRHDYWAFLHIRGLKDNHDQPIGAPRFGTSQWSPGEEVRQSLTFRVPADTPPGHYPLHAGIWLPSTGKQLRVSATELPIVRRAVVIGSLTVSR